MELGGGNNGGGFHGFRRISGQKSSDTADIVMGLRPHPGGPATDDNNVECVVREQDRFMPIANVIRIMRKILPPHAKISDDAKETIQECVSEYISFITSEANDRCQREQRKTITAEDVLWAMSKLGFDDYIEPLTVYLHRYREYDGGERGSSIRGEAMVKRVVVEQHGGGGMGMGFPGFHPAAAFHHVGAAHHGYFQHHAAAGVAPTQQMNFFKEQGSAGTSQATVACAEQFPTVKEQL